MALAVSKSLCHNTEIYHNIQQESAFMASPQNMGISVQDQLRSLLDNVLQIGPRIQRFNNETALLGSLPEFDSMAVISLITAIEEHFDFEVADDEIEAETFATLGDLCRFVESKIDL